MNDKTECLLKSLLGQITRDSNFQKSQRDDVCHGLVMALSKSHNSWSILVVKEFLDVSLKA